MKINVFRVDDRLIHGQIVTKWVKHAQAKRILVVDDKAANDPMLKMILQLAVPGSIEFVLKTKVEGIKYIEEDNSEINTLLIMRTPKEALDFINMGYMTNEINIGNISNSKSETGRTQLLDYIYIETGDVEAINSLLSLGITLDVKAIPEERTKNIKSLLEKVK